MLDEGAALNRPESQSGTGRVDCRCLPRGTSSERGPRPAISLPLKPSSVRGLRRGNYGTDHDIRIQPKTRSIGAQPHERCAQPGLDAPDSSHAKGLFCHSNRVLFQYIVILPTPNQPWTREAMRPAFAPRSRSTRQPRRRGIVPDTVRLAEAANTRPTPYLERETESISAIQGGALRKPLPKRNEIQYE